MAKKSDCVRVRWAVWAMRVDDPQTYEQVGVSSMPGPAVAIAQEAGKGDGYAYVVLWMGSECHQTVYDTLNGWDCNALAPRKMRALFRRL